MMLSVNFRFGQIGGCTAAPFALSVLPARLVPMHQHYNIPSPVSQQQLRPSTHRDMILNDGLGLIVVFAHFSKEGRGVCVVMPISSPVQKKIAAIVDGNSNLRARRRARFSFPQLRRRTNIDRRTSYAASGPAGRGRLLKSLICGAKRDQLSKIGFARSLKNRTPVLYSTVSP